MSRKHRRKSKMQVEKPAASKSKLHGVKGFRGPDLIEMVCPQCDKKRMVREVGHTISIINTISLDNSRKRFVDVCDACKIRFFREDEDYKNRRVKEAVEALEKKENLTGNTSLEDAL